MNMTLKGASLCVFVMCSHINEYHENAILSTLDESQAMFESSASQRIWDMMDKEFEAAKTSILENERTKTSIHLSPPLSSMIHSFIHSLISQTIFLSTHANSLLLPFSLVRISSFIDHRSKPER